MNTGYSALFEAARAARRPGSPNRAHCDHAPITTTPADRLGGNRACLALARKLLKRGFHTRRELGDDALLSASTSLGAPGAPSHRCTAAGSPRTLPPPAGGRPPKISSNALSERHRS